MENITITCIVATAFRVRVFEPGLLASSQHASGRSCDRPTVPSFPVVSVCPGASRNQSSALQCVLLVQPFQRIIILLLGII